MRVLNGESIGDGPVVLHLVHGSDGDFVLAALQRSSVIGPILTLVKPPDAQLPGGVIVVSIPAEGSIVVIPDEHAIKPHLHLIVVDGAYRVVDKTLQAGHGPGDVVDERQDNRVGDLDAATVGHTVVGDEAEDGPTTIR